MIVDHDNRFPWPLLPRLIIIDQVHVIFARGNNRCRSTNRKDRKFKLAPYFNFEKITNLLKSARRKFNKKLKIMNYFKTYEWMRACEAEEVASFCFSEPVTEMIKLDSSN
jgi:hypothetical protein